MTLAIVTILNHFEKARWCLSSILLGILAGYGMAMFLGMIDFMPVQQAEWFHLAKPFHLESDLSLLLLLRWLFSISSIPYRPSEILLPPQKAALAGSLRAENCQEAS
ncbi:MAG: solute carrier family 23 protein [[Clostridium] scindens]